MMTALIDKIAAYDAPVLIEGETGTGKELAARAIHYQGARRDKPFVPVNCGALPDSLVESELFGHRRGAFTDARNDCPGLVEMADTGTLFLDEVDSLSPKAQVTLLRFLQDQRYRPLGAREQRRVDVRVITACNRDLEALAESGSFRPDLLYRLRLMQLRVPALRERTGDAMLLAEHFILTGSARFGKPCKPLDTASVAWFDSYAWPGNVRELENRVQQAFLLAEGSMVAVAEPARSAGSGDTHGDTRTYVHAKNRAIAEFELRYLGQAMRTAGGNVSAAARLIGTERRHLSRLLKKYGIQQSSQHI
jgi:DNA-binding NtrC family response regulator